MADLQRVSKQNILLATGWMVLLAIAVWWRLPNIDAFGLLNDEGAYMMWARQVAAGYPLYTETFTGSPPLFIGLLALVFRLFGFSVVGARFFMLAWFVLLACAAGYLSRRIAGWTGAFTALIIVAVSPLLFPLSRQVMLELPALVLALIAVLCGYHFFVKVPAWRWPPSIWIVPAGLFLSLSLLVKILHPFAALPVLWFIWRASESNAERSKRVVGFGLAGLLTLAAVMAFFDWGSFFDQAIRFRSETQSSLVSLLTPANIEMIIAFAGQHWGLTLLALAGAIVSIRTTRGQAWLLWMAAGFALLLWYQPIFPHHLTILFLPVFLLAMEFIAFARLKRAQRWVWVLVLLAALNLPAWVQTDRHDLEIETGGREADAAQILKRVTRPTDFVMSDSLLLALFADRMTPPPLADLSLVYIQSGRQTADRLISLSTDYQVTAVAPWALRMVWLPDYVDWARQNFWVHKVYDNDHQLFFGPKHPAGEPIPNEISAQFEAGITLRGYTVDAAPSVDVTDLPLTLYWQAESPAEADYTLFVQLLDPAGTLVAQNDSQPIFSYFPTSQWPPGEIIPDRVALSLPPDLSLGSYTLIAGVYNGQTMVRLRLLQTGHDFIPLSQIELK